MKSPLLNEKKKCNINGRRTYLQIFLKISCLKRARHRKILYQTFDVSSITIKIKKYRLNKFVIRISTRSKPQKLLGLHAGKHPYFPRVRRPSASHQLSMLNFQMGNTDVKKSVDVETIFIDAADRTMIINSVGKLPFRWLGRDDYCSLFDNDLSCLHAGVARMTRR